MFDARPSAIERLGKVLWLLFGGCAIRNGRADAAGTGGLPVGLGVIAFVAYGSSRCDVGAKVEQRLEMRAVADFATGQVETQRIAIPVGLEVDLG